MQNEARLHEFRVGSRDAGRRLDIFLKERVPGRARAFFCARIAAGGVTVNGGVAQKAGHHLKKGDAVVLREEPAQTQLMPQPELAIPLLFEDRELLVLDKPPGMNVHPARVSGSGTVVNWLVAHVPALRTVGDSPLRPGIVHRLDRGTSGVILIAKTQRMFMHLKDLFAERLIEKEYAAIVEGAPPRAQGVVEGYLVPSQREYRKKELRSLPLAGRARSSRTRYEILEKRGVISIVRFFPETGRTHQIRVHAASLGAPILGDRLYGAKIALPPQFAGRFFLHAARIRFPGLGGEKHGFSAPIPADFTEVLLWLDKNYRPR